MNTRALATTAILLSFGAAAATIEEPVRIDTGAVSGAATGSPDVRVFKGIPYAAPPVGELRWRAPKPASHWEGTRTADEFGPMCMQAGQAKNISEDCLYLNVWTGAQKANEKRPVMLWIYGGGYYTGSGSQPMYDGEALAKKGAVVVTINYRLGAFGFFAHPELTKESDRREAANFGVMDGIAALHWVKNNIAKFGGDPKDVTIFGESAGAGMVATLMTIPSAKGLFSRAIGESSAWATTKVEPFKTLADAEQMGVKLGDAIGAKSLADLRAAPAEAIQKAGRGLGPVVDGSLIPQDPGKVFAAGKQTDIPVLTGSNRDESFGGNPKSAAEFVEQAHMRFGDMADAFLKLYPAGSDEEARESAFYSGRDEMAFVMRNWARLAAKPGKSKAFVYYFTEQPPRLPNARGPFAPGPHGSATHVSEILYAFGHLDSSRTWTDSDKQVADEMSSYWVNFARKGDPNGNGLSKWPAYDGTERAVMVLGNPPVGPEAPSEARLAFFQSYFDKLTAR